MCDSLKHWTVADTAVTPCLRQTGHAVGRLHSLCTPLSGAPLFCPRYKRTPLSGPARAPLPSWRGAGPQAMHALDYPRSQPSGVDTTTVLFHIPANV